MDLLSVLDYLRNFLYDGFPRNVHQAEQLDVILKDLHEAIESVVNLEVPEKVLLDRITKRATTDSRTDDNAEVFKARLKVYEHDTKPLLDYYHRQGKLRSINGNQSRDQVAAAIAHALPKLK
jgi:adenylate kinase